MIVYKHDKPGLGEGASETFEPKFLNPCIAVRHRDGRMPGKPILRHEQPPAEAVAALELEFHVAPLDHHALRGEAITVGIGVHPERRATAGYCRPCLDRSAHIGFATASDRPWRGVGALSRATVPHAQ